MNIELKGPGTATPVASFLAQLRASGGPVAQIQAAGLRCLVYTANTAGVIARLRGMGADGVFSDFPERVLQGNAKVFAPGWH